MEVSHAVQFSCTLIPNPLSPSLNPFWSGCLKVNSSVVLSACYVTFLSFVCLNLCCLFQLHFYFKYLVFFWSLVVVV